MLLTIKLKCFSINMFVGPTTTCQRTPSSRPRCDNSSLRHGAGFAWDESWRESHRNHPPSKQFRGNCRLRYQGKNGGNHLKKTTCQVQAVSSARRPGLGQLTRLGWIGFGSSIMLPRCPAASVKFPLVQAELGKDSKSKSTQLRSQSWWNNL